jgi:2-aminoethylphosphonate aminotransferase
VKTVKRNILLTPGPATTTNSVKLAQVVSDICPRVPEFGQLLVNISTELTRLVSDPDRYTTVLFGGSGTAAVESMISSVLGEKDLAVIINNGAYGKRMCEIANAYGFRFLQFTSTPVDAIDLDALEAFIKSSRQTITHLAVVHHETTTGLLNDIEAIGQLCKLYEIDLLVDAISSYAAIPIDMEKMNIRYLASSSNKNLQGMAGVSFVISEKNKLKSLKYKKTKNYYLNLYEQHRFFSEYQQMRFTPPVQTLYALQKALEELKQEGVKNRYQRYVKSWETLIAGITNLGLTYIVPETCHSKLVTAIVEPDQDDYDFQKMHDYFYERGITIYPGKLDSLKTFRVANIGDITFEDIEMFLELLDRYLGSLDHKKRKGVNG